MPRDSKVIALTAWCALALWAAMALAMPFGRLERAERTLRAHYLDAMAARGACVPLVDAAAADHTHADHGCPLCAGSAATPVSAPPAARPILLASAGPELPARSAPLPATHAGPSQPRAPPASAA